MEIFLCYLLSCFQISDAILAVRYSTWSYFNSKNWSSYCETKQKCSYQVLGQLCNIDLVPNSWWPWPPILKVKLQNSRLSVIGRPINRGWNRCESIIHDHDTGLWMTTVVSMDVHVSDQGDFRYRCAVDIFSSMKIYELRLKFQCSLFLKV